MKCTRCKQKAVVALPSHNAGFCASCFLLYFQNQMEKAIKKQKMFSPRHKILVALSGGKDSLALALQLKLLGYNLECLHLDLDISDTSKQVKTIAQRFCERFELKLHIIELKKENLSIPEVKKKLSRPICSACGQIKRYYFNYFAKQNNFDVLATGHTLDDEVSRLFANTLRWDITYLQQQSPILEQDQEFVRKVKPLYRLTEFETAVFCFLHNIQYSTIPCPYSKGASFTFYKRLLDELEYNQPGRKFNFYETFLKQKSQLFPPSTSKNKINFCSICGYPTLQDICGVCRIKKMLSKTS
ncbi:MAG: TIGR00269 family protein [Desulfonauticus sp.]|nr:TIGR00269 family protein [Desulfonauticus sp.]